MTGQFGCILSGMGELGTSKRSSIRALSLGAPTGNPAFKSWMDRFLKQFLRVNPRPVLCILP